MTLHTQDRFGVGARKADARFMRVLVVLGVWTLVCGGATFGMLLPGWREWVKGAISLFAFTTMFAIYWTMAGKRTHKFARSRIDVLMNVITGAFVSGTFSLISVIGVGVVPLIVRYYSVEQYQSELSRYKNEPDGFTYIKSIAKQNFGVNLILADANVGWMDTQFESPMRSPASVNVGPGFCEMRIFPSGVESQGVGSKYELQAWLRGVQIHEIGHCIDMQRDFNSDNELVSHPKSMPPLRSGEVASIGLWGSPASKQWREAYSDLLAIGYWHLEYPMIFEKLYSQIVSKRREGIYAKHSDLTHDTSCWLAWGAKNEYPRNLKDLPTWAETIREKAPCKVTASWVAAKM